MRASAWVRVRSLSRVAADVRVVEVDVDAGEQRRDLLVLLVADRAEQGRRRDLALAIDLDPQLVLVVGLELEPRAAVRDDLGAEQHPAGRGVLGLAVVDARRADELADDDALGAVDDERALVGHPRVVAHVDALALDLAGLLDQELDVDVERLAERQVLGPALLLGVLGRAELVVEELELHDLAGEVLDRADLVEQFAKPLLDEPGERIELEFDQVRDLELLVADAIDLPVDAGVRDATRRGSGASRRLSRQHEAPLLDGGRRGEREAGLTEGVGYRDFASCQTPQNVLGNGRFGLADQVRGRASVAVGTREVSRFRRSGGCRPKAPVSTDASAPEGA